MSVSNDERPAAANGLVLVLVPDVFFAVTVRNAVKGIGYEPLVCKKTSELVAIAGQREAMLAVIDLGAVRSQAEWGEIGELTAGGLTTLVFGPHKDVDGLRAAKAAGVTRVVSNGQFHREMSELIARYAASVPDDRDPVGDDDLTSAEVEP